MTDWITVRPPTEADADADGDVLVPRGPGSPLRRLVHWSYVNLGTPWRHTACWRPPVEPAPEPPAQPAAERQPEPATELPEEIRAGVTPFYVLVVSDDTGGRASGGKAIAWETAIASGSSLEAVLQRRANVGNRYGPTFVAECRILSDQKIATRAEPAAEPTPQPRKVPRGFLAFFDMPRNTQGGPERTVVAIATDHTAWYREPDRLGGDWAQVPPLPDREEPLDA